MNLPSAAFSLRDTILNLIRGMEFPDPPVGERLETCSPTMFQRMMPIDSRVWYPLEPECSSETFPGEFVRRRWSNFVGPTGMVIAADPRSSQFLILWFR